VSEIARVDAGALESLAARINAEHRAFVGSFNKTAEHGIRAGELLNQAKNQCQHGEWLSWLDENFEGSVRAAQVYMQLFENRREILKCAESAHLSIDGALKAIAGPSHNHRALGTGDNEWHTPPDWLDDVRAVLGKIDLDPASSDAAQESVRATRYFTQEDDGLAHEWHGRVFLNPPYAQPHIEHFAVKLVEEYRAGRTTEAIMLTHNYTDTRWFHIGLSAPAAIFFPLGRIKFVKPNGKLAKCMQGQTLFYYGERPEAFRNVFSKRDGKVIVL
jgi:phage N-6-adenine-methyltransferase